MQRIQGELQEKRVNRVPVGLKQTQASVAMGPVAMGPVATGRVATGPVALLAILAVMRTSDAMRDLLSVQPRRDASTFPRA